MSGQDIYHRKRDQFPSLYFLIFLAPTYSRHWELSERYAAAACCSLVCFWPGLRSRTSGRVGGTFLVRMLTLKYYSGRWGSVLQELRNNLPDNDPIATSGRPSWASRPSPPPTSLPPPGTARPPIPNIPYLNPGFTTRQTGPMMPPSIPGVPGSSLEIPNMKPVPIPNSNPSTNDGCPQVSLQRFQTSSQESPRELVHLVSLMTRLKKSRGSTAG